MNTFIDVESNNIEIADTLEVNISVIEPNETIITLTETPSNEITFTDVGVQGMKGAKGDVGENGINGIGLNYSWSTTNLGIKREDENSFVFVDLKGSKGDNLTFDTLTVEQKEELRGDVGSTETNYVNIFLNSLLS